MLLSELFLYDLIYKCWKLSNKLDACAARPAEILHPGSLPSLSADQLAMNYPARCA